jgi:hypothetical protein
MSVKTLKRFAVGWVAIPGLVNLFGVGPLGPPPVSGQPKAKLEILSKDEARQVFAMSRAQWTEHVRNLVAAGQAQALGRVESGLRMATQTPEGDILMVQPDYFKGDSRPAVIHVTVGYRPPRARQLTEGAIQEVIAAAQRQMAPEFDVIGHHETAEQGLIVFFSITERRQ